MTTRALTAQQTPEPVMKRQVCQQPATPDRSGDVRVGVYVRRSTDDEHQPYSIEAQDVRLAAYIGSQPDHWWPLVSSPVAAGPVQPGVPG